MSEFVFFYRGGMGDAKKLSAKEMEEQMRRWHAWAGKLRQEGQLKDFGQPLERDSRLVAKGGVITDGPFAEGNAVIGGYSIIKAKDLTEAATIAEGCPIFHTGGSVEVRPVQEL